jgi:hypothetical protein
MIEQFFPLVIPGPPATVTTERAILECGCAAYVGQRMDNGEGAVIATPCSAEHRPLMAHFTLLYRESLVEPIAAPASEIAERLLDEARRHVPEAA